MSDSFTGESVSIGFDRSVESTVACDDNYSMMSVEPLLHQPAMNKIPMSPASPSFNQSVMIERPNILMELKYDSPVTTKRPGSSVDPGFDVPNTKRRNAHPVELKIHEELERYDTDWNRSREMRPEAIDYFRDHVLGLVASASPNLVFLHAVMKRGICFGFGVSSSNRMCEGVGMPFDHLNRRYYLSAFTTYVGVNPRHEQNQRRRSENQTPGSIVNPEDAVRFIASNVECPFLVMCEFSYPFLSDLCYLRDLEVPDKRCCVCKGRPVYVSPDKKVLFCYRHAHAYSGRLQLYQPNLLQVELLEQEMLLYTVIYDTRSPDPLMAATWKLLASREIPHLKSVTGRQDGLAENLMELARDQKLEWRSDDPEDGLNVAKTLQSLCTRDYFHLDDGERKGDWTWTKSQSQPLHLRSQ